jgi:SprT protein
MQMKNNMITEDTRREVYNRIDKAIIGLEETFGTTLDQPDVEYNLRGTTAGQAFRLQNKIRLNTYALEHEYDGMMNRTIPHEVCHLYAYKHFGNRIKPHGREWKLCMRTLGLSEKRCHSYQLPSARKHKKYAFHCSNCGYEFSLGIVRANKIKRGITYSHKKCGGKLVVGTNNGIYA